MASGPLNRRRFITLTGLALSGLALPSGLRAGTVALPPPPAEGSGPAPFQAYLGLKAVYRVSFWWFKRAGTIFLSLQRRTDGRGYLALAGGRTTGMVGTLTGQMIFEYRSFMTLDRPAGRLISHRFEESSIQGSRSFRVVMLFDHDTQKISRIKPRLNRPPEIKLKEMTSPLTVDHLACFFNWRAGVYGPPEPGRIYRMATMPSNGNTETLVNFLSRAETERRRAREETDLPFLLEVRIDPKMIHSRTGLVSGWTGPNLLPEIFTLNDIRLLGTVRARLERLERIPEETNLGPLFPQEMIEPRGEVV